MKRLLAIILFLTAGIYVFAQDFPSEWIRYTSDGYYHDIESASAKQEALNMARTNLARQIQVRVKEVSQVDKNVVNGRSSIRYASSQNLSTNVDMNLAETKSYFNETLGKYYVLVYINKSEACTFYENEVKMLISNVGNSVAVADNYIGTGFKAQAKGELQNALKMIGKADKSFFWFNVFGLDEYQIQQYLTRVHGLEQTVKQKLADLEYGTTYCVVCNADFYGQQYFKLLNEVKGELSSSGCNFVDSPESADYTIYIQAAARNYNEFQGAYFTYVDAAISIDKNATGQRIFEDEISVKGAHTLGYKEAGRDGYKKLSKEISKVLKENIKL